MDPSGDTIGYNTIMVLDEVISRLEKIIHCKRYCAILKHVVMRLKPRINKAMNFCNLNLTCMEFPPFL
jgi:hypothetical protein